MRHQGKILKSEMEFRKVTQAEMAKVLGVSRSTVQRIYSSQNIEDWVIDRICEEFDMSADIFRDDQTCLEKLSRLQAEMIDLLKKFNEKDEEIRRLRDELSEYHDIKFYTAEKNRLEEYKQKKGST